MPGDHTEQGAVTSATNWSFASVAPTGERLAVTRAVAEETPIAIEFNGIGYAVLMATPADIIDLAFGFARSERLIDSAADVLDTDMHVADPGMVLRVALADRVAARIADRVRHRISESSCGMCGIENLAQALRPLPDVADPAMATDAAVFRAIEALRAAQPLNRDTGAVHAAAACSRDGAIMLVREDVGRHNAFDKLIGAMLRRGTTWDGGFALLSSRCSYELVEKAVLAGCPMLVTISAPTALALRRAASSGLALRVLARHDSVLVPR